MTKTILFALVITGLLSALFAQAEHSPYAGQEKMTIKALSQGEIENFLSGVGMGFAKAAELNHYPGPKHVLELADQLELSETQQQQARQSYGKMKEAAMKLGKEIVESETELDRLFAGQSADSQKIAALVNKIAALTGELRFTHLNAHLEMKKYLTPQQIRMYDLLRGYSEGSEHNH